MSGHLKYNFNAALDAMETPIKPGRQRVYARDEDGELLPGLSYEAFSVRSGLARPVMGYIFGDLREATKPMLNTRLETIWCIVEIIKDELYSGRYEYPAQLIGLTIERMLQEKLPFNKIRITKKKEATNGRA